MGRATALAVAVVGLMACFFTPLPAQTGLVTVREVIVSGNDDAAQIEIVSSGPVRASTERLGNPERIVLDIADAVPAPRLRSTGANSALVKSVRVSTYRANPPVTRVVADVGTVAEYDVSSGTDRVILRLRAKRTMAQTPAQPATAASAPPSSGSSSSSRQEQAVGDLGVVPESSGAKVKGSVVLAAGGGTRVMSGSSISASDAPTSLKLSRGGELRICPRTSISIANSQGGRDLLVGMGAGAIETHYSLAASADSVLTPDFRILLPGPGTFHFAIGADARGNTCIRSLESNTASLIVSELMGDGTYQVKPSEQVLFRGGTVASPTNALPPDCGCPASIPAQRAQVPPPPPPPQHQPTGPETAQLPPSAPDDVHIQVDAPFVFRANETPVEYPPEIQLLQLARVQLTRMPPLLLENIAVAPPPPPVPQTIAAKPAKPEKKGFFSKIGKFFASIFR